MIGFKAIEFYIPNKLLDVNELTEIKKLTLHEQEMFKLLEIETIPVAEDMTSIDMAYEASVKALEAAKVNAEEIDLIISIPSRVPEYMMSSEATRLQNLLKANNAFSLSVTDLGCANINGAILLAKNFLMSNQKAKNVLICYGSKPYGEKRYRNGVTVIGDAGMGLIISKQVDGNKIIDLNIKTDGQFWDLYKVKFRDRLVEDYEELCENNRLKFQLSTTSNKVFTNLFSQLINENNISKIDGYIIQNLSVPGLKFNEKTFDFSFADSCYSNCRNYGHLGSVDILLNYKMSVLNKEFKSGDKILVLNNSPVACWTSMILEV
ncbi:hypothetical protein [Alkaliphilus transvaalensis]|uniref:hypothetical protein n=1 Tax=Alkaliphilus transvaalensis TaxID=114628 RepID=UPI00047C4B77|nr:hypothetical protein [Alkaliphilus transvaalensis]